MLISNKIHYFRNFVLQKYIKYSIVLVEQWNNYTKTGFLLSNV